MRGHLGALQNSEGHSYSAPPPPIVMSLLQTGTHWFCNTAASCARKNAAVDSYNSAVHSILGPIKNVGVHIRPQRWLILTDFFSPDHVVKHGFCYHDVCPSACILFLSSSVRARCFGLVVFERTFNVTCIIILQAHGRRSRGGGQEGTSPPRIWSGGR